MPHSSVNPRQRARARSLRQTMTRAETLLWRYLEAHRSDGLGFRRQAPIGPYIVDFVCHDRRLVVELDGESHDFEERLERDQTRDAWLTTQGYLVLRYTNREVLSNLEGVVISIAQTARERGEAAPPSLSLPHKGGGNPQTLTSNVAPSLRKRGRGCIEQDRP
ncbi:MAG: endonuclease domain-containing protein [Hyphomicrobiales bacterium]|nr:endonuclease domain-containing protein [Hyphomicrobiales bacterium]